MTSTGKKERKIATRSKAGEKDRVCGAEPKEVDEEKVAMVHKERNAEQTEQVGYKK